eukprot:TRINITY_DN5595_c0_g1_i2.p1 TRINITY_DN5595_c0_g1~~TRINITY_DN5595_c0_g1_i2.p1  ORF type:complete len:250 (+),score=27.61 TRINITY_DN5595_c0_g1_i2:103-852(+)
MEDFKPNGSRWTKEEDNALMEYVHKYGPSEWGMLDWRSDFKIFRGAEACKKRWSRLQERMKKRPSEDKSPKRSPLNGCVKKPKSIHSNSSSLMDGSEHRGPTQSDIATERQHGDLEKDGYVLQGTFDVQQASLVGPLHHEMKFNGHGQDQCCSAEFSVRASVLYETHKTFKEDVLSRVGTSGFKIQETRRSTDAENTTKRCTESQFIDFQAIKEKITGERKGRIDLRKAQEMNPMRMDILFDLNLPPNF